MNFAVITLDFMQFLCARHRFFAEEFDGSAHPDQSFFADVLVCQGILTPEQVPYLGRVPTTLLYEQDSDVTALHGSVAAGKG